MNFAREPEYVAILVKGESSIQAIAEVHSQESDLKGGKIVFKNAVSVSMPIRFGKDKLEGIRYTTFRKLITHRNTDHL